MILRKIINFFLRGLLVILPIALTGYFIYSSVRWIDGLVDVNIPGAGIVIVLVSVTLIGALFSGYIGRLFYGILDDILVRTPFVKIIYTSLKDVIEAFVGEKKRFTEPVLVSINSSEGAQMIGFITRKELSFLGLNNKVAVYFPYSYSLTGLVMIVDSTRVTKLDVSPTEAMKFAVSAGITGFGV